MTRTYPAIAELAVWAGATYGDAPALRFHRDGDWQEMSYAELAGAVRATADGLTSIGIGPGDRVAVLAETCPEWTVADLAIASVGAVLVPVYPTNSAPECAWVLGDSGAKLVLCGSAEQVDRVAALRPELPLLQHIVAFTETPGAVSLAELRARGVRAAPAEPELNTIIYTSGTTGPPKGCLLTERNWRASLTAIGPLVRVGPGDVMFLYLPQAHLFARIVQFLTLSHGATLGFFRGDIRQLLPDLAALRPTILPSVPRLFEKVHSTVQGLGLPPEQVPEMVRAALGGRLREGLSGAAPIAPAVLEFFADCGIPVYEAYGMTESTALISGNHPGAWKFGTVGRPFPGIEVRIAEDGEVLARGENVFPGYHNNPAATAETVVDGWLHTGDLGALDEDGFLRITGRKKDIIITAGGKNLTPANLENDLRGCRWISQAVMHGDRRPYPVALITLDPEELPHLARELDLTGEPAELAAHPKVRAVIEQVVEQANANYAPPERIRRFALLGNDFSVETGELTPTLKLRRAVVADRYAAELDALYRET
ncbi:AMP-dependent synthetase/ligase [Crossiella sp. SN42]|uniref:AMP-dependent synthetase/ligase n=1 Tax=Crossiella sp. SN42 TaxID=2944808 RepID=UPI00207C2FBC|nr:AMP-dependent synthetase/ligase [Crossiella sp. SN42]MCO1577395.1 AMP-dependent synthetase/ligase [Crossiella sp. SN42]